MGFSAGEKRSLSEFSHPVKNTDGEESFFCVSESTVHVPDGDESSVIMDSDRRSTLALPVTFHLAFSDIGSLQTLRTLGRR